MISSSILLFCFFVRGTGGKSSTAGRLRRFETSVSSDARATVLGGTSVYHQKNTQGVGVSKNDMGGFGARGRAENGTMQDVAAGRCARVGTCPLVRIRNAYAHSVSACMFEPACAYARGKVITAPSQSHVMCARTFLHGPALRRVYLAARGRGSSGKWCYVLATSRCMGGRMCDRRPACRDPPSDPGRCCSSRSSWLRAGVDGL